MFKRVKDYLIPHKSNGYAPLLFAAESVGTLLLVLLLLQMVFVVHTAMLRNSDFLAAVLPSVLISMTNTDRVEAGVSELQSDPLLTRAAQLKANDMAAKGYFSHIDPSGRSPWHWLTQVGYEYSYAGENLAIDFSESAEVEQAWMASPAHKANIVKGKFTKVGIGVAKGIYEGRETTFVVQFFATPPAEPVVVAIVEEPIIELAVSEVAEVEQETIAAVELSELGTARVLGVDTVAQEVVQESAKVVAVVVPEPKHSMGSTLQNRFIRLASSPSDWFMPLLVSLFALLAFAFVLSFVMHVSKREVEGMAIASFMFVLLAGLVHFNFGSGTMAAVPQDGQYASAIGVLY